MHASFAGNAWWSLRSCSIISRRHTKHNTPTPRKITMNIGSAMSEAVAVSKHGKLKSSATKKRPSAVLPPEMASLTVSNLDRLIIAVAVEPKEGENQDLFVEKIRLENGDEWEIPKLT